VPVGLNALPLKLHPQERGFLYLGIGRPFRDNVHMHIIEMQRSACQAAYHHVIRLKGALTP